MGPFSFGALNYEHKTIPITISLYSKHTQCVLLLAVYIKSESIRLNVGPGIVKFDLNLGKSNMLSLSD